jgi:hypothetical protein
LCKRANYPKLTIKWYRARVEEPEIIFQGLLKAGLPEQYEPRCLSVKFGTRIFRTVSDGSLIRANTNDRSTRTFAVKPAPSARRYAAMGLTARRGRAKRLPFPLMKFP